MDQYLSTWNPRPEQNCNPTGQKTAAATAIASLIGNDTDKDTLGQQTSAATAIASPTGDDTNKASGKCNNDIYADNLFSSHHRTIFLHDVKI